MHDIIRELFNKLTELEKRTANASIERLDNGDAYRRACSEMGKAESNTPAASGCEILNRPKVRAYVVAATAPREEALEADGDYAIMTRDEGLRILSNIARTPNLTTFETVRYFTEEGGVVEQTLWHVPETAEMTEAERACIAGIKVSKNGNVEVLQHSQTDALKQLADLGGWKAAPKAAVKPDGEVLEQTAVILDPALYELTRAAMIAKDDI